MHIRRDKPTANAPTATTGCMTEKNKYLNLIRNKRANGLKDVKFFQGNTFDANEEDVYAELNRLHEANNLPDAEVLGKHSK